MTTSSKWETWRTSIVHTIVVPLGDRSHCHSAFENAAAGSQNHRRHIATIRLWRIKGSLLRRISEWNINFLLEPFIALNSKTTHPAPNGNPVFVNEAHFDEFPTGPNQKGQLEEDRRWLRSGSKWRTLIIVINLDPVVTSLAWSCVPYLAAVIWSSTS